MQKEHIMLSLDVLSATGAELSTEQLAEVDGGIVPIIVAVLYFGIGYYIGTHL
jgi:lactobin A/cerein 7B family class IIb bacteriocin